MSLSNLVIRYQYAGNASSQTFAFPALFLDNTHLKVVTTVLGLNTLRTYLSEYSVLGVNNPVGGNVTLNFIPPVGMTVTIYRDPPLSQLVDYVSGDNFPSDTHEAVVDKLTMICQLLSARLDRTIRIPITDIFLPELAINERKSKIPAFDWQGNPTYVDGTPIGDITNVGITAFTGGTGVSLDSVATTTLVAGTLLRIQIGGLGNPLTTVQLLAISTAPSTAAIIRPLDYNAITNIKEWVVIG